jgi:hypothetical protein
VPLLGVAFLLSGAGRIARYGMMDPGPSAISHSRPSASVTRVAGAEREGDEPQLLGLRLWHLLRLEWDRELLRLGLLLLASRHLRVTWKPTRP